jgi:hypothetical protein
MPVVVTNPHFDPDSYLASGGRLTDLIIPAKEKRFWGAQAEMALSALSTDEQPAARARFARLRAFCDRLGERVADMRIGDVMSEEDAQTAWRETVDADYRSP